MQEKIEKQIKVYIYQALEIIKTAKVEGKTDIKANTENPKLDFKRQWHDLKTPKGISEFLKDTTAIANTVGLDGYIVYGFDDKTGEFFDSYFEDSNLKDTSDINGIIIKGCSNLFDINYYPIEVEGKKLGVLHIPPTLEKPIVITNYQKFDKEGKLKGEESHRTFIRKGTSIYPASKYDLEMMFYDRKNIQPDYDLDVEITKIKFSNYNIFQSEGKINAFTLILNFHIENLGRKSISIYNLVLKVRTATFNQETTYQREVEPWNKGEMKKTTKNAFVFENMDPEFIKEVCNRHELEISLRIEMTNGKTLYKTFDFIPEYSS